MSGKKILLCTMSFVLLTACKGQAEPTQKALDLRTQLLEAGGCGFTSVITADYGERVYEFTVDCAYDGGDAEIEVLAPENIAGITLAVSADGAEVRFDDLELEFGQLAGGKVSPMTAPWLLTKCWTSAYISSAGADGDLERITYLDGYEEEQVTVDTWLDAAGAPVRGEISCDGRRQLTLEISGFRME